MNREDALEIIGDPDRVVRELEVFGQTSRYLASNYDRLVQRYPGQWIAAHTGKVRARGATLEDVLEKLDAGGFSRSQAIVRYLDPEPKTLIL